VFFICKYIKIIIFLFFKNIFLISGYRDDPKLYKKINLKQTKKTYKFLKKNKQILENDT
jgi:hypothetical protein